MYKVKPTVFGRTGPTTEERKVDVEKTATAEIPMSDLDESEPHVIKCRVVLSRSDYHHPWFAAEGGAL